MHKYNNISSKLRDPRIQQRRDKQNTWIERDPVLLQGEFGYETDTNRLKIGNGVNSWNNLPYIDDSNIDQVIIDNINNHINDTSNPHNVQPNQQDSINYVLLFENNLI